MAGRAASRAKPVGQKVANFRSELELDGRYNFNKDAAEFPEQFKNGR